MAAGTVLTIRHYFVYIDRGNVLESEFHCCSIVSIPRCSARAASEMVRTNPFTCKVHVREICHVTMMNTHPRPGLSIERHFSHLIS